MATAKQELGKRGEILVTKHSSCPRCKRLHTLKRLPPNFKCADVICDFCGYLAQVKTTKVKRTDRVPKRIAGAAWAPQKERMDSGIYFPLFVVLVAARDYSIYFLPSDLQTPRMFKMRKPLSANARRSGWQGFEYDFTNDAALRFHRLH